MHRVAEARLPTELRRRGRSSATATTSTTHEHVALVYGEIGDGENVLVRMHSKCLTGDVFHSHALRLRLAARHGDADDRSRRDAA